MRLLRTVKPRHKHKTTDVPLILNFGQKWRSQPYSCVLGAYSGLAGGPVFGIATFYPKALDAEPGEIELCQDRQLFHPCWAQQCDLLTICHATKVPPPN